MKRDMELVRAILMKVEECDGPLAISELVDSKHGLQMIAYHVDLMTAYGLLDARVDYVLGGEGRVVAGGMVQGLTWDGHDYLDAIRNDGVWERTKRVVKDTVGSTTMGLIKDVAIAIGRQVIMSGLE